LGYFKPLMSILLPRFFRSAFRNDPIASFLMTMGAADVALGGVSGHGGLLILGVIVFGGALGLKWTQSQRRTQEFVEQTAQHYLPSESSQSELPMLSINKKRPPT
jgi:uncharacterized membrane protein SpoIIM required for sporulation